MPITLTPDSMNRLIRLAEKSPAIAQKHIDAAIVRSIGEVDRQVQPLVPVDTARLRNDLHGGIRFSPFRGRIGSDLPYARRVHDLHAPGTPYFHPAKNKNAVAGFLHVAADGSRATIERAFEQAVENIVTDLAR